MPSTHADVEDLKREFNLIETKVENGIKEFTEWYLDFYKINLKNK